MENITVEEWYAELERVTSEVSAGNDAGMTIEEIKEALKMKADKARSFLKTGLKSGRLKLGKRYIARDWDGRGRSYTVYCVVK